VIQAGLRAEVVAPAIAAATAALASPAPSVIRRGW
jgi:hypothetical protein